LRSALAARSP